MPLMHHKQLPLLIDENSSAVTTFKSGDFIFLKSVMPFFKALVTVHLLIFATYDQRKELAIQSAVNCP